MTEKNDFRDTLTNQLDKQDILIDYSPLVDDYAKAGSTEEAVALRDLIVSKALSELDVKELQALRDNFTQKGLQLSGKQKLRMYELSTRISNGIIEINAGTNTINKPNLNENITTNETINENLPNFRVESGSAIINGKEYILNLNPNFKPEIKKIGDNEYSMNLVFLRNSKSSSRGPENIEIKFNYDGENIIFFGDKNRNDDFDKNEYGRLYKVDDQNYTKIIPQADGTTIIKTFDTTQNITLGKEHLNHYGVDAVKFTIEF